MLEGIFTLKKLVLSRIGLPDLPKPGRGGRARGPGFSPSVAPAQKAQATYTLLHNLHVHVHVLLAVLKNTVILQFTI